MKLLSLYIIIFAMLFTLPSCRQNMNSYENIAVVIRNSNITENKLIKFKASDLADVSSIKEVEGSILPETGHGKGNIWAYKNASNLEIFIESDDEGNLGRFGYAYSESDEKPAWKALAGEKLWIVDEKINAHWWKISSHEK